MTAPAKSAPGKAPAKQSDRALRNNLTADSLLQLFTSSFAAYAFAKMNFKGKNVLFLGYIATIAVPWQAYMAPQFMMMRAWHLNNTHLAIICLRAFSAFGVFLMKQFYEGVPSELCEAARIDGLTEYGLIMAASVIALIPVLAVFLALQKYFVQGVASTGLKG